jgi:hypothetical protein
MRRYLTLPPGALRSFVQSRSLMASSNLRITIHRHRESSARADGLADVKSSGAIKIGILSECPHH